MDGDGDVSTVLYLRILIHFIISECPNFSSTPLRLTFSCSTRYRDNTSMITCLVDVLSPPTSPTRCLTRGPHFVFMFRRIPFSRYAERLGVLRLLSSPSTLTPTVFTKVPHHPDLTRDFLFNLTLLTSPVLLPILFCGPPSLRLGSPTPSSPITSCLSSLYLSSDLTLRVPST